MLESLKNFIIDNSASLTAITTCIVAAVKILKSFGSNFDGLKKELNVEMKNQANKLNSLQVNQEGLQKLSNYLLNDNQALKNQLSELTQKLDKQNELHAYIEALSNNVNKLSEQVDSTVQEAINRGYESVDAIKNDMKAIGEYHDIKDNS